MPTNQFQKQQDFQSCLKKILFIVNKSSYFGAVFGKLWIIELNSEKLHLCFKTGLPLNFLTEVLLKKFTAAHFLSLLSQSQVEEPQQEQLELNPRLSSLEAPKPSVQPLSKGASI